MPTPPGSSGIPISSTTRRFLGPAIPLLTFGILTLLLALFAGLLRLGWNIPLVKASLAQYHSVLMVSGFFGLIISLERAVALPQRFFYLAPVGVCLGSLSLILGFPHPVPDALYSASGLILMGAYAVIHRASPGIHSWVMGAGALCWAAAHALLFSGYSVTQVTPLWMAFLVLTIAGERLELSRAFAVPQSARLAFSALSFLLLTGAGGIPFFPLASRYFGALLVGIAIWLLRFDPSPRLWKLPGLTRYNAISLTLGYLWLAIGGSLFLAYPFISGPRFDPLVHSVMLGFVFSMILGHFPIIIPALTSISLRFSSAFYVPLILLHLSVAGRVISGLTYAYLWRQWAGLTNFVAVLLLLIVVASSAFSAASRHPRNMPL